MQKRSIIEGDRDRCFICHREGIPLQVHHCQHGQRRKFADKYGLTVHLCVKCHMLVHDTGEHDRELQALGQRAFEERYGHKRYMQESGKDYLSGAHKSFWVDNADSYICADCGYETSHLEALCPRCGALMNVYAARRTDEED